MGRNYLEHIKETNAPIPAEPVFFAKTINSLISNNEPIIYPKVLYENIEFNQVDHEVELACVIFQKCKNVSAEMAINYILGYTIFLDMTARNMQISDRNNKLPWYRSKNFDTFGPIGPKIVLRSEIKDPHSLNIQLKVNGEIKQKSNTMHMLFRIPQILEYVSKFVTLMPGDIIATGTPSGISPVKPGDILEASIENIGTITHKIILEK